MQALPRADVLDSMTTDDEKMHAWAQACSGRRTFPAWLLDGWRAWDYQWEHARIRRWLLS